MTTPAVEFIECIDPPSSGEATASDGSLMRRLQAGSQGAAKRLYRRYARRLRGLARAKTSAGLNRLVDPDDIVQSVFMRFFRAAREGNYTVPAGEDLWDLLLVITLNKIRTEETYHRAAKRDMRRTTDAPNSNWSWAVMSQRNETSEALLRLSIQEALEQLPERYRSVVELRMDGYEVAEIAQRTKRSKRTIERILKESRTALSSVLNEQES